MIATTINTKHRTVSILMLSEVTPMPLKDEFSALYYTPNTLTTVRQNSSAVSWISKMARWSTGEITNLCWPNHNDATVKKAHQHLYFLRRQRKFTTQKLL